MKKKLLALILAGVMTLSLAACGGAKETPAPAEEKPAETEAPAETPAAETYKIGICLPFQLVEKIPTDEHDVRMDEVLF